MMYGMQYSSEHSLRVVVCGVAALVQLVDHGKLTGLHCSLTRQLHNTNKHNQKEHNTKHYIAATTEQNTKQNRTE